MPTITTNTVKKLVYLGPKGILTRTRDGDIVNIGGISTSAAFTLNGKPLLFADGSSTGGPGYGGVTLQSSYDNSLDVAGNASIKLSTGKDFAIYDDTNNNVFFKVDSETGAITITGDLIVEGSASIINTQVQQADHWVVSPSSPTVRPLVIEPAVGVIPTVNYVDIFNSNGGDSIFAIQPDGKTVLDSLDVNRDINVAGLVNGINIVNLANSVLSHLTRSIQLKHAATEISVEPVQSAPGAVNVQEALSALGTAIQEVGAVAASIKALEFIQNIPATTWFINHNQNTKRIHYTIWDDLDENVMPDYVKQIDANNMEVYFGAAQTGRLVLMCF